jgi:asparagine N-glycosylation enzyme membrane subunit Stt3
MTSTTTGLFFFALILGGVHYLLFYKDLLKLKGKAPGIFVSFGIVVGLAVILLVVLYGPSFIFDKLKDVYIDLVRPFSRNRWALTVAESQQPYFVDWLSQFTWKYLVLVFAGAVLLFYETFKSVGKRVYYITGAYALFILAFALNRYSPGSTFNGETNISIALYLGSMVLFALYLVYFIYDLKFRSKEVYEHWWNNLNIEYMFVTIFFVCLMVGARSAQRLLFVFAPVTAILAAYFVFIVVKYTFSLKDKNWKYGLWVALILLVGIILYGFAQAVIVSAESSGTTYNQQWQYAMGWVRENTPEDAVFAHWWDYGYLVQTGGERATVSDGGNAVNGVNHLLGRHFLLAANDTEALEFLYAKNVSYTVVVSEDISKYGAFASIGSDANYDRYSWISVYSLDLSQSQETRDGSNAVYIGGTYLDEDVTYNNVLLPGYNAGIGGFIVPISVTENSTAIGFGQPQAIVGYNGQYYNLFLSCIYFGGEKIEFDDYDLSGCLMIIPTYDGTTINEVGAGLYLSSRVMNTWFAKYYLLGEEDEFFKVVYSDEQNVPLMLYNGRIIGPLKIWKVSYPGDLEIPEEYYTNEIDPAVDTVR